jgi:hypothetical protein
MGTEQKDQIGKLDRDGAVHMLQVIKDRIGNNPTNMTWEWYRILLKEAGERVGYAPAFRCLVIGMSPEDSVKWGK